MKQKGLMAAVMAAALLFTSCGGSPEKELDQFLLREGASLTVQLEELAGSKAYIDLMTGEEMIKAELAVIKGSGFQAPKQVYLIAFPENHWIEILDQLTDRETAELPDNIREVVNSRINSTLFSSMVNAGYGTVTLASATLVSFGKSYPMPKGWQNNALLLFECEGDYSSLVSFTRTGDGVISGYVSPLKNGDAGTWSSLEELLDLDGSLQYSVYSGEDVAALLAG